MGDETELDGPPDTLPPTRPDDVLARRVGERYRIIALLGAGGMGCVYRAYDEEIGEEVALKLLVNADLSQTSRLDLLRQEVRLARRVTHQNVARVFDLAIHDGLRFITMEYVEGGVLRSALALSKTHESRWLQRIALDTMRGLTAIHAAGIVHRDLKPDNVLVGKHAAKIADFGISREARVESTDTAGTPRYMSPEVLCGASADERSDIYALGLILAELYGADTSSLGRLPAARQEGAADAVRHVSPRLAALVARCLAPFPEDRPTHVSDIAAEFSSLDEIVERGPLSTVRSPPLRRLRVQVRPMLSDACSEATATGLEAMLVAQLAATPRLFVMQGSVSASDAHAVVESRLQQVGSKLQISMGARGASDGVPISAHVSTVPLQEAIVALSTMVGELAASLSSPRVQQRREPLRDREAVDLFIRGRAGLARFEFADDVVDLLSRARERAPSDPLVLCAYAIAVTRAVTPASGSMPDALVAVRRAIELAPELPDVYAALGCVLYSMNDNVGAAQTLVTALSLAPSNFEAQVLVGVLLAEVGRTTHALRRFDLARLLHPNHPLALMNKVVCAGLAGERGPLLELLDQFAASMPQDTSTLGALLRITAHFDDSALTARVRDVLSKRPEEGCRVAARVLDRSIDDASVHAWLEPLRAGSASHVRRQVFAKVADCELNAWLRRYDRALESLAAACELSLTDIFWLERSALLAPLRSTAEYQRIHRSVADRARALDVALQDDLLTT